MATQAAGQLTPINTKNLHPQPEQPLTVTDVDDPSHPLYHHRRTVADFEYGEALGEGSYSTVLVARDKKTGKQYAIKKLDKAHIVKNDKVKYVMIERDALGRMNHPGIVKLYWTFRDNKSLYYVIDLAPHGELYTFIRKMAPLDMETTRYYASEILLAVNHIHSKDVVHRDIKPENILLDGQMHIKIADFGSAKLLYDNSNTSNQSSGARSFVGTAQYVAPELLRSDPTSKEADWWAFGCVIFQMLSGRSPFKAATDYLIFQKIKNLDYEFPEDFPPVAKDLVQKLLVLDVDGRLGSDAMGGVNSIMAHSFFESVDFGQVFHQPAPPKAQQYMEDWKWQQAQQQLNRGSGHGNQDDDDGFGTWFDGNEQHKVDHHQELEQHSSPRQRRQQRYQQEQYYREAASSPTGNPFSDEAANPIQQTPTSPTQPLTDPIDTTIHFSSPTESIPPCSPQRPHFTKTNSTQATFSTLHSTTQDRLGNQSHPPWISHLYPSESIVRAGRVNRRRGLFTKKRYLILTDRPRLLYLDEGQEQDGSGGGLRCEIGWTSKLFPELKGKSLFSIHTPDKSYTFEVAKGQAEDWVNTLNTMLVDSFGLAA
ncbi:kinase-like domain-containing protein [Chlamydoabsidia padenii]|nr:kinase-like domain-containing protein [Chlamydoabsidia padenii]